MSFEDVFLIDIKKTNDNRGSFSPIFEQTRWHGIEFVQDNVSVSLPGVIRGLHYQIAPHAQAKLLTVLDGHIIDVVVDINPDSGSFGQWQAFDIGQYSQIFIPEHYAHGFMAIERSVIMYKVSSPWEPSAERTLRYDYSDIISDRLGEIGTAIKDLEHVGYVSTKDRDGRDLTYLEVCNRKFQPQTTIFDVKKRVEEIVESYGHRALLAETNQGIDWKALMHSVRVIAEAFEFLSTGKITFPRPEKDLLLQIRKGELPYQKVAEIIETGVIAVEEAESTSSLPAEPDYKYAEQFVVEFYKSRIICMGLV